jgi:uncharacterized protein (AIM24 family)
MANFQVRHLEGMRYVEIHLNQEMVRCEAGSLNYMIGKIRIHSQLIPSVASLLSSWLSGESVYRPTYTGSGVITLESSLGGFHVLELQGQSWILEKGAYWASEGSVDLKFFKEKMLTSLYAGEGFVYLQSQVTGYGKVVVTTKGPVEVIDLQEDQEVVVDGECVIGRMASVRFSLRRPTENYFGRFTAGEPIVRVYRGPGKLLLNPTFYWRYYLSQRHGF